jgi:hypothetical protein
VGQQWQRVIEPCQQVGGRQDPHPRRGQLQREGDAVQAPADRGNRRRVVVRQREHAARCLCPVDEQLRRRCRFDLTGGGSVVERRHLQRLQRVAPLVTDAQRLAAGGEHRHTRCPLEQRRDIGCPGEHMFHVVEQHEDAPVTERADQRLDHRLVLC